MTSSTKSAGQALRLALLASCAAAIFTEPAFAQDDAQSEGQGQAIVITGSRIARPNDTATSPIVTVDSELIQKSASVNIEANLNKLPQFAPAVTQFVNSTGRGDIQANANNTVGATTVSLRQLGSNRNLVLVDGRRPTPINGTGVVDINAIPSAAIDRVEVITGGASSTYGADAVGGVVNFILKKNFQGIAVDSQIGLTQEGDGREMRFSGLIGANVDGGRGNVMLGAEHYDRNLVTLGSRQAYRDFLSSPNTPGNTIFGLEQDYVTVPTAAIAGGTLSQSAVNALFQSKGLPTNVNVPLTSSFYINSDATLFLSGAGSQNGAYFPLLYGYNGTVDGLNRKITSAGLLRDNYTDQLLSTPLTRWSFFGKANYEVADHINAFLQATFVKTQVITRNLVPPAVGSWGTYIPHGTDIYTGNAALNIPSSLNADGTTNVKYLAGGQYGLSCPATGGCTNSQVFPVPTELAQILDANGPNSIKVFQISKFLKQIGERYTDNQNVTFQVLAGFNGDIPGTDWTWEVFGSHGETDAKTDQYNFASVDRWRDILSAPNYGYGFSLKGNSLSNTPGGGFQGATGTCASGVNPFTTPVWTADCRLAVKLDLQNENRVYQDMAEANIQGGLVKLPYGQLRFALGAAYRRNSLNFKTDSASTEGTAWLESVNGVYPQGNTSGSTQVRELYGELLVPLLADMTFVHDLHLELGYRMSDYNTVGTVGTYKINGEYAPTRWLRFRGGYQKASRAPNLGELYTARTSTLGSSNDGDPCSPLDPAAPAGIGNYSANPVNPNAAKVVALCKQIMGTEGAAVYYASGRTDYPTYSNGGLSFPSLVGNASLKPETATTYTIGGVINAPSDNPWFRRLNVSLDYYNIKLTNAIAQGGVDAVYRRCFSAIYNPNFTLNEFCKLIGRYPNNGEVQSVSVTYTNAGRVETSGWDLQVNWAWDLHDIGTGLPGVFSVSVQGTYLEHFKITTDDGIIAPLEYAGTMGSASGDVGTTPGAYRWKLFTTFNYAVGPVSIGLQWQHKPATHPAAYASNPSTPITGVPAYDLFNLNGTISVTRGATLRLGVDNLFNKQPPVFNYDPTRTGANLTGQGATIDAANYDVLGRRFFIGCAFKL